MLIPIQGLTEENILNTDTSPSGGGLRPFPCTSTGWTRHTAVVMKATVKSFTVQNVQKDNIALTVANGQFGGEVLISLQPDDVGSLTGDAATKRHQQNLQNLQKIIKQLGCHTQGKLDTGKLEKARGQEIEVIAKHKGFREYEGRQYHKVQLIYTGEARVWQDVDESIGLPPLPTGGAAPAQVADFNDDDIPF